MTPRTRGDRCPGALRPWPAEDGLLVRLRLVGGRVASGQLRALMTVAEEYGDGRVHPTSRANLQLRGLPGTAGRLAPEVLTALAATGLLPSRSHELVRNIMVSPQTGLAGGLADLRGVAARLDALLCAGPRLAGLPGRFLFVLDDGHGDLLSRDCDLGLVVLSAAAAQMRIGPSWGPVVPLSAAADRIIELAGRFLDERGTGPAAPWHVGELPTPLVAAAPPDPRLPVPSGPLPYGEVPGGHHVLVPDTGLDRAALAALDAEELVVTPWHGVLVPKEPSHA